MATNTEYVKFSDFVNGLDSLTESEKNAAKIPTTNASGNPKKESLGNYEGARQLSVVSNPEYAYVIVDANDAFLFGIKSDGSIEWQKGIPSVIKKEIVERLLEKVDKVDGKSLIDSVFANSQSNSSNPEFLKVIEDFDGNVIEAINNKGQHEFFEEIILHKGIKEEKICDLSNEKSAFIPKPEFAILNFKGMDSFPETKTSDFAAVLEFYDNNGNYFKKNVIVNAQGNSSMIFPKKNISIDICNDKWLGDDTFKIKIGSWVEQDSFHIKSYYCDYFRSTPLVGYELYDEMEKTRDSFNDRTWKKALISKDNALIIGLGVGAESRNDLRIDNGARCYPDGFPCKVLLNGKFYGIFCFQLKKHRDNYEMEKDNAKHIHLDGTIDATTMWDGVIDWTKFEIRNPKTLYCTSGSKYDGENPSEIAGSELVESWIANGVLPDGTVITTKLSKALRMTAEVKMHIQDFANSIGKITAKTTESERKTEFEKYYSHDNLIDYQIFGDVLANVDGFSKNWQWTTWDGVKWYVNPYDLDQLFGLVYTGEFAASPLTSRICLNKGNYPNKLANQLYNDKMISRYAELRHGVFSIGNILRKIEKITSIIGKENLNLEYEKWRECPCNRDLVVNTEFWRLIVSEDGKPVIATTKPNLYNKNTSYNVGDVVVGVMGNFDNSVDPHWYYSFECVKSCSGKSPAIYGYRDNIWRIQKWMEKQLENMDALYNYTMEA